MPNFQILISYQIWCNFRAELKVKNLCMGGYKGSITIVKLQNSQVSQVDDLKKKY